MKKFLSVCLFFIFYIIFLIKPVHAVSYPSFSGYVNDFAGLYSSQFKSNLESKLSDFEKSTGSEIAVVTVKSLEGTDIETYAVELFEKWKIGKKSKDNGLLFLISKDDRKIRIEVGYGLEQYITDGRAGEIIRNQISPEFKKDNYEGGTLAAVEKIQKYISDKDIAQAPSPSNPGDSDFWFIIVIVIFYVISTYVAGYLGRTREIWPGGAIGSVLGAVVGFFIAAVFGVIFFGLIFGGVGLLLDYILTKNYQKRKEKGLPTGFFHTWGGFSGGGRSGGGFGGFGGGSSGGGGASGRW